VEQEPKKVEQVEQGRTLYTLQGWNKVAPKVEQGRTRRPALVPLSSLSEGTKKARKNIRTS